MENEYNKRFKNKEMSNDDFDVEGLWDNISEELDSTSPDSPVFPWSKVGGSLLLLLALSVIGLGLFNTSNNTLSENNTSLANIKTIENDKKKADRQTKETLNTTKEIKGTLSSVDDSSSTFSSSKKQSNSEERTTAITESKNQAVNTDVKNNYNSRKPSDLNLTKTRVQSQKTKNKDEQKQDKKQDFQIVDNIKQVEKNTINPQEKNTGSDVMEANAGNSNLPAPEKKKGKKLNLLVKPLKVQINPLKAFVPTIEDSLLYVGIREISRKKVSEDNKNKRKVAFEGGIYGGINQTFAQFNSTSDATYADARNTTESSVFGVSYGAQMSIMYKGWRVNTGAAFQNIWTQLNTQIPIDTASVFVPQALTLVVIDSTGNTVNTILQDTTVNATTTRTIRHYNNFQMWSIPLEFGRYRAGKKWTYGFSTGTSFNFLINQTGKILDSDNQLSEFDKNSDNVLFQSFGISLRANLMLGYKIKENVIVSLSPQWNWTRSNLFNNTLQVDVHQVNLSLGLRATF